MGKKYRFSANHLHEVGTIKQTDKNLFFQARGLEAEVEELYRFCSISGSDGVN